MSSPGDRRNGSHPSRLPSAHLAQPQHPVSSQPIPSPADSTRPQVEQNKPCPKQFRGASISYILSSASPSTTANSDIVARPRTPPPSVLSPPLLAQTKESDLQSHRPYNTPPSPAQTPKANTQSDSHSRARSVHFPPGANGIIRMPPPRSPQRHHSTGPEGLVTYSCESASAGDSSTPRHSSTDSDDRGSSAPPLTYMEPVTVPSSDCNTCRLRADAKLEQINSMNAAYKAQTKNGEKRDLSDMASLVQAIQRNNHQYVQESERCPECHQPPPPPVRNNYLGESSPRPNKRKSPSCVSSEPEETCSKARRTTPDESLSRDAEEAFGLLPTLAGSRHTWTPRQGPQRPVPGVEAD